MYNNMYISWLVCFVSGLNLVLQQPLTTALTKTKADTYYEKELLLLIVSLVQSHHILAIATLSTNLSGPEPLTQVELLSSDNEQDVYTLLALQIRFEAKSKKIIDKVILQYLVILKYRK